MYVTDEESTRCHGLAEPVAKPQEDNTRTQTSTQARCNSHTSATIQVLAHTLSASASSRTHPALPPQTHTVADCLPQHHPAISSQMLSSWWQSQSKGARVFTRVAVVTGLVIVGIHYNQHQERQVGACVRGCCRGCQEAGRG